MNGAYQIIWKRVVIERKLAQLVATLSEQGESVEPITEAMARFDQLLSVNPTDRGESRGEFERVLVVPPLCITFEVHQEERIVYVLGLRYAPPRRRPG
jgi:hypothetical protein